jgi:hypothetical protein
LTEEDVKEGIEDATRELLQTAWRKKKNFQSGRNRLPLVET